MTTSHHIFTATPQFDSGRWKLRLDFAPLNIAKQTTASTAFDPTARDGNETEFPWVTAKNENKPA
jgi:hypothetical protein